MNSQKIISKLEHEQFKNPLASIELFEYYLPEIIACSYLDCESYFVSLKILISNLIESNNFLYSERMLKIILFFYRSMRMRFDDYHNLFMKNYLSDAYDLFMFQYQIQTHHYTVV